MREELSQKFRVVRLANGATSIRALDYGETFHPVIGPVLEAEALYVRQLALPERFAVSHQEFVLWDVGLGAAANPITVLCSLQGIEGCVRIVSFDQTLEPLQFALQHSSELGYLGGFETQLQKLLQHRNVRFQLPSGPEVLWDLHLGDFPSLIHQTEAEELPKPHAILYDAFSPARNPSMWTLPLFARIFSLLDIERPCTLPTYSRSTLLRVTLLLAGFFVGVGHPTGEKEETTIASNDLQLISEPLGLEWLGRAQRSRSAEPLHSPVYLQAPLSTQSRAALIAHPQFAVGSCPQPGC